MSTSAVSLEATSGSPPTVQESAAQQRRMLKKRQMLPQGFKKM